MLAPKEYGLFTLVFTTVLFIQTFAFSWLNQANLRYFEKFKDEYIQEFFSTTLLVFLSLSIVLTLIWILGVWLFTGMLDQRLRSLLLIGPLVLFFDSGSNLMFTLLRAMRQGLRYSLQRTSHALIKLTVSLCLIFFFSFQAEALLYGIILGGSSVFVFECFRLTSKWQIKLRGFRKEILSMFAKYGLPLIGLSFANLILSASDRYFIEVFSGADQVGIYSAGYKLTETGVLLFVSFIMLSFFPVLIETFERKGEPEARKLMQDIMSVFVVLMLPIVTGICVLSKDIITAFLGEDYLQAHKIIPLISTGIFFMGLSYFFNKSFELKEKNLFMLIMLTGVSILNILLNLMLIPTLGILGAAISTFIAYLSYLLLSATIGSKILSWNFPWSICLKALLASLIMGFIIWLLPCLHNTWGSLFYKMGVGCAFYLVFISLLEKRIFRIASSFFSYRNLLNDTQ